MCSQCGDQQTTKRAVEQIFAVFDLRHVACASRLQMSFVRELSSVMSISWSYVRRLHLHLLRTSSAYILCVGVPLTGLCWRYVDPGSYVRVSSPFLIENSSWRFAVVQITLLILYMCSWTVPSSSNPLIAFSASAVLILVRLPIHLYSFIRGPFLPVRELFPFEGSFLAAFTLIFQRGWISPVCLFAQVFIIFCDGFS